MPFPFNLCVVNAVVLVVVFVLVVAVVFNLQHVKQTTFKASNMSRFLFFWGFQLSVYGVAAPMASGK